MERIKNDDVSILFVRDMDRRLVTEFRAVAYLQGISMRDAVSAALRNHIKGYVRAADLCPGQYGLDAKNWEEGK